MFFYKATLEIELKTIFTSFGDIFGGMRKITNFKNVMINNTWITCSTPAAPLGNQTKSKEVQKPLEIAGFFYGKKMDILICGIN
jgi:hypothetical protein